MEVIFTFPAWVPFYTKDGKVFKSMCCILYCTLFHHSLVPYVW